MVFNPTAFVAGAEPLMEDFSEAVWSPLLKHECSFGPEIFHDVMTNLIKNPNNNSSWLFRADILFDQEGDVEDIHSEGTDQPRLAQFRDFQLKRTLVRRLIPRNTRRDDPLDQTCLFYEGASEKQTRSLVVYLPHTSTADELPFYHPRVQGVAHLHDWDFASNKGTISVHYWLFNDADIQITKLVRTAQMLLSVLSKHGEGRVTGYVKRVNHDVLIPQARFQNKYAQFKLKYASDLIQTWAESTDPVKHVFEDLGIAAFLIELWADMYKDKPFPGFVDIGCGNGLLVHLLQQEGFNGWGFDARARKSWDNYSQNSGGQDSLRKLVLLPSVVRRPERNKDGDALIDEDDIHDGLFPSGTFIISNHADELTPWTPILAAISDCPFIIIPCCSHSLTGAKYRAPAPRDKSKGSSTFASLVDWVSQIAEECGWDVETEMLRIPSTRNTGLVGRRRTEVANTVDIDEIIRKYGGTEGYFENVAKLTKIAPRGH